MTIKFEQLLKEFEQLNDQFNNAFNTYINTTSKLRPAYMISRSNYYKYKEEYA
ncbi:15978_t:CDS:1, partial [Gigaspora margarita]